MRSISKNELRSSEHVSPSHPDKVCDLIAERLLCATKQQNPDAFFACDGSIKNNVLTLVGEVSDRLDKKEENRIIYDTLEELGYGVDYCEAFDLKAYGSRFGWYINKTFTEQSPDINVGVTSSEEGLSAGDIGIMFGYAVDEAPDLTYLPHWIARVILRDLYGVWKDHLYTVKLRPDMKCLVTMGYLYGKPVSIKKVVVCVSHVGTTSEIAPVVLNLVRSKLDCIVHMLNLDDTVTPEISINPTGEFSIYGPVGDSGLVGRKIVCDQYGGAAPVGGGNLNGKDASKVDRSGVYMARYMAKKIVYEGLAREAIVQLAYEIGKPKAVSINVRTDGTPFWKNRTLRNFVKKFDTSVPAIIERFGLNNLPEYVHDEIAAWGHIGERVEAILPWEAVR